MLLALCVGQMRGTVDDATVERIVRELKNMPLYIKDVLGLADKIKNLSKIYTYARNFLYLGRGYNYPTALEGALKLKEISYIHAEGYPAAEMKHGPIALVDSEMPTVVIAPTDSLYDKIISNVRQVKARGGTVVAIITKGNDAMKDIADHCLEVPDVPECLTPLVVSVPLQLLAYYIAINKDRNVDQPRNLAKSVTVELSLIVTILFALCIEAGIFMLIAHWWGMTAAITVIAIECVLALWTVYEMRHASDEPVDE